MRGILCCVNFVTLAVRVIVPLYYYGAVTAVTSYSHKKYNKTTMMDADDVALSQLGIEVNWTNNTPGN